MRILHIKNPKNISPFAPEWSYFILESKLDDEEVISKLRDIILSKEQEILESTPAPKEDQGNTSLGPYSLTSRYPHFNVLSWRHDHPEVMVLYNFIKEHFELFLNSLEVNIPECSIQCWANVLRKGQHISVHRHETSPYSFLSGNITIQAQETKTHYYVSEVYDPGAYPFYSADNKPGSFNIFQSHMLHETSITESEEPRISVAFDIQLGDLSKVEERSFELFYSE